MDNQPRRVKRFAGLESLTTSNVLALHERIFGVLDGQTKNRIISIARQNGWDRTWDDAPLAA